MKRSAILLLLVSAAALPAAALAQVEAEAKTEVPGESVEMLTTKWSLNQPRKKNQALGTANWRGEQPRAKALGQTAAVAGPAVPAAQRTKLPKPKQRKSSQRLPNNRTNASKTIAAVIRK